MELYREGIKVTVGSCESRLKTCFSWPERNPFLKGNIKFFKKTLLLTQYEICLSSVKIDKVSFLKYRQ